MEYDRAMQMTHAGLQDIPAAVDRLLYDAIQRRASDVHVEPGRDAYELKMRVDGLLQTQATIDPAEGRGIVTRLMVMAQLLTYRQDIPQEGRLRFGPPGGGEAVEMMANYVFEERGGQVSSVLIRQGGRRIAQLEVEKGSGEISARPGVSVGTGGGGDRSGR